MTHVYLSTYLLLILMMCLFLTGDLNHMETSRFESILGFMQIINTPTHNQNIINKFITNRPDLYSVQAMQSLVKAKHKAFLVNCDKPADNIRSVQPHHMVEVRLYRPTVANLLCHTTH